LKLANILLNFPMEEPILVGDRYYSQMDLISMDSLAKIAFLKQVDLTRVKFEIKIADFGFSKFLDSKSERSNTMCGTPLYMAP
jgi:serine/threonine protein kinase